MLPSREVFIFFEWRLANKLEASRSWQSFPGLQWCITVLRYRLGKDTVREANWIYGGSTLLEVKLNDRHALGVKQWQICFVHICGKRRLFASAGLHGANCLLGQRGSGPWGDHLGSEAVFDSKEAISNLAVNVVGNHGCWCEIVYW